MPRASGSGRPDGRTEAGPFSRSTATRPWAEHSQRAHSAGTVRKPRAHSPRPHACRHVRIAEDRLLHRQYGQQWWLRVLCEPDLSLGGSQLHRDNCWRGDRVRPHEPALTHYAPSTQTPHPRQKVRSLGRGCGVGTRDMERTRRRRGRLLTGLDDGRRWPCPSDSPSAAPAGGSRSRSPSGRSRRPQCRPRTARAPHRRSTRRPRST
jgi:hypothetical protein